MGVFDCLGGLRIASWASLSIVGERMKAPARMMSAAPASEAAYGLAEGPVWDGERERVLWVDISAGHVHSGSLAGDAVTPSAQLRFGETVGAVVCSAGGELLVAGRRDLYRVAPDSRPELLATVIPAAKSSRLNDGACDPAGRFLVGSLALDAPAGDECLWQIGEGGSVRIIDADLTLSNGLAWSPDGGVLYSVDTIPGIVWARPYDAASGDWGARAVLMRLPDESPDGLCVDTTGNLWIAIWGAGEVRCYSPAGERMATVNVPAPHTSSVAFVGAARDRLLITTARDELSGAQLAEWPLSGRLFIADVGAAGVPTTPWRGS
jgi:sugar lactone lactonase YvrE